MSKISLKNNISLVVTISVPPLVIVGEGDEQVQVCATLSSIIDRDVSFMFSTIENTGASPNGKQLVKNMILLSYVGLEGSDYVGISSTGVFLSGSTRKDVICINISIIDDQIYDDEQTFILLLTTEDSQVILGPPSALITIIDQDDGTNFRVVLILYEIFATIFFL